MADQTIVDPSFEGIQGEDVFSNRIVSVSASVIYFFYKDTVTGTPRIRYTKSLDGGASWELPVHFFSTSPDDNPLMRFELWYEGWTPGDSGTLIHVIMTRRTGLSAGLYYKNIDTDGDGLSLSQRIEDTAITGVGNLDRLQITRDMDGDLWVTLMLQGSFRLFRSINDGVDWTTSVADSSTIDAQAGVDVDDVRHACLLPGFSNDQPIMIAETAGTDDRIVLLQYNPTNDNFDFMDDLVTGHTVALPTVWFMGCAQRDGDLAIFCCYVTLTSPATVRCLTILSTDLFHDNLVHTGPAAPNDDIRNPQVYVDLVNGEVYCAWLEGNASANTLEAHWTKSVNSGFLWDPETQFSAAPAADFTGLYTPYSNADVAGTYFLAWYDEDNELFQTDDANKVLNGLFTVSEEVSPPQLVVSCLTGNPE